MLKRRNPKQNELRYNSSFVLVATTEDMPHSSGVSDEPVNNISPYLTTCCFSLSAILTLSSICIFRLGLKYTLRYVINFAFPSLKSSFDFPVKPPKKAPISSNFLYSTPFGQSFCINSCNLLIIHPPLIPQLSCLSLHATHSHVPQSDEYARSVP